jgi:drug/metabolite transporter (DMT)-like permease
MALMPAPGAGRRRGNPMRLKSDLILLLVPLLWGTAFIAMRVAAGHGTIFYLNGTRFLLGALLLLPFAKLKHAFTRRNLVFVGLAGLALFGAVSLQQAGLATTTAGNGGFITSLSVVIVPLLLWVLWRERLSLMTGAAILLAIGGGFLLSTGGTFNRLNPGDLLILVGAFFWALHVVVVGKGQPHIDPLSFAIGQYAVCGLLNLAVGPFFERPTPAQMSYVLPAILYTAVFSVAIGFTLQVFAQKYTPPTDAALIMSLEGVFAAFFGWLLLHESLRPVQLAGCAAIMAAVILVQVRNGKIPAAPNPA